MALVAGILYYALLLFSLALWVRFIVELVQGVNPRWRPGRVLVVIVEIVFTITDPPIKLVRRLIPPLRMGPMALDFGIVVCLIVTSILMNIVGNFV